MAPPPKRRRRNVLPSSDSEDDTEPGGTAHSLSDIISSSPTSNEINMTSSQPAERPGVSVPKPPRAKTSNQPHNAAPIYLPSKSNRNVKTATKSPTASPEKSRNKRSKIEDKVKSGNIHTFFTKQAQRQQGQGLVTRTTVQPPVASQSSFDHDDDLISDEEISHDGNRKPFGSVVGLAAKKRARGTDLFKVGEESLPSASQRLAPSASQMFLTSSRTKEITPRNEDDMRPWAERFAPANLDELAVHKRKVGDVRTWLEDVIAGKMRQRLLILKGNAGTGKTTTVQLLAKALNCDILEWRNPVSSVASSDGFQSMSDQFEEFLGRGGKFGQLDIFSDNGKLSESKSADSRRQIILVEEFPNTFTRGSTALQSFRSTLLQYLASNTPSLSLSGYKAASETVTPVVMVISETLLTTTSASADSFTAHRLLGPEILQHPGVGVIEFNAVAPTFLAKGLELIVQKESRISGRKKTPGPLVLKKLGEIGDIRSAIGSLEFMCLRGDVDGDWGSKVTFGKGKKISKDTSLTKMEEESLELITRREASLGIFHAVGKVVYNKREETVPLLDAGKDIEQLPEHLTLHSRPRRSDVHVDQLIDETGTDTQTFVATLHENYLLSCDAAATNYDFSSLDHVNGCVDALSDSDLLCPSWDGSFGSTGFGGGTGGRGTGGDILRQDEISFQIAVRGILFSLPYPVKRKASAPSGLRTGRRGDEFKMFYPTSLKLWRMKEEIESSIDLWVTKLMKGDEQLSAVTAGAAAFVRPKVSTVESWKSTRTSTQVISTSKQDVAPLMAVGTSARKEMLLERLPYMVAIAKGRKFAASTLAIRDMEKVTSFHGIGGPVEESPDDDDEPLGEQWATDKPGEGRSPKKRLAIRGRGSTFGISQQEQKLVLSDDDIEDD